MQGERIVVGTKEELEHAIDQGAPEIEVRGELAERVRKASALRNSSKWTLRLLSFGIAAIPFTGGMSGVAVAPIAAVTGLSIPVIVAIIALGLALIMAIKEKYDIEIELEASAPDGAPRVILRYRLKPTD